MSLDNFGRSELIHLLIEKMGLNKQSATEMLVREKLSRPGRNPRSGEDAEISARRVVTLRPSPLFKKKLDDTHAL